MPITQCNRLLWNSASGKGIVGSFAALLHLARAVSLHWCTDSDGLLWCWLCEGHHESDSRESHRVTVPIRHFAHSERYPPMSSICPSQHLTLLQGLMYMHQMAILHLDVKAANILLTEEGVIKLADFGVSEVLKVRHAMILSMEPKYSPSKTSDMTKEQDDYVGSPLFMSPEVIRKEGYNNRTDIWSLGITIIGRFSDCFVL